MPHYQLGSSIARAYCSHGGFGPSDFRCHHLCRSDGFHVTHCCCLGDDDCGSHSDHSHCSGGDKCAGTDWPASAGNEEADSEAES